MQAVDYTTFGVFKYFVTCARTKPKPTTNHDGRLNNSIFVDIKSTSTGANIVPIDQSNAFERLTNVFLFSSVIILFIY